jgi:hypothetical protein
VSLTYEIEYPASGRNQKLGNCGPSFVTPKSSQGKCFGLNPDVFRFLSGIVECETEVRG